MLAVIITIFKEQCLLEAATLCHTRKADMETQELAAYYGMVGMVVESPICAEPPPETKECWDCRRMKELAEFSPKLRASNRREQCKACNSKSVQKWTSENVKKPNRRHNRRRGLSEEYRKALRVEYAAKKYRQRRDLKKVVDKNSER